MSSENRITLELEPDVVNVEDEVETIYLEPILNNFIDGYIRGLSYCMPAQVVNVQNVDELRIDVKPLNNILNLDGSVTELPIIRNVPMMCFGTDDSAILISPKQGQTVLLLFSQLSLDEFKGGSITPYNAVSNRKNDIQDAIAIPSIFPFNRSPNRSVRHYTEHSTEDLTVVHNLGTSRENKVILKRSGSIGVISSKSVDIDSPTTKITGELKVTGEIHSDTDMIISGRSLLKFMDTHDHNYTDDGSPAVTSVPNNN
mgnify:CR=1 FL=1